MKLSISQASTLPTPFEADVQGAVDGGCSLIEVWLTKLEQALEKTSTEQLQQFLQERDVRFAAAAYHGGLLLSQGEARQTAFDHFRQRLDLCQTFHIPLIVLVPDTTTVSLDPTSLGRVVVSLTQAAQWAAGYGIHVALEFRAGNVLCNNLQTALALIGECRQPNLGVCLDWFHFYAGPSKEDDLQLLTKQNLAHVQVCDVAGILRERMTDSDRIFPGEGDFEYARLMQRLRELNYEGAVSLELFNPVLWKVKPSQVSELGLTSLQRLVNQ
jgi:4-hydroxyphenylpyruvate dioxygenase